MSPLDPAPAARPTVRGVRLTPARLIALSFLAAIAVGTALLALPVAHAPDVRVGVLDALFTATSAVCVTGLIVVDTGGDFSRFGQVVILLLFQLGGLGLLTLGTFLIVSAGGRLGYGARKRVQQQVSAFDAADALRLVRAIVVLTVTAEALGALLLLPALSGGGPRDGAFSALFHSVSAFNNAGFSLYADSLADHVTDPLVNAAVIPLVVVGGLGFVVIVDVLAWSRDRALRRLRTGNRTPASLRRRIARRTARGSGARRARLSLHARMAVAITGFLIGVAVVVVLVLEWNNEATLGGLSLPGRLTAGLFQAVTPRTAGFNTLDYAQMSTPTVVFTMLLMFIGGNPGSTAGGIKTLTFFVLAVSVWSVVRQRGEYTVFGRRLSTETVVRAGVIAFGGVMIAGAALTLLTITEPDAPLLPLLFETVSALGTVGLSLGITAELSDAGKLVVVALMFLGRVGFLTFALALVTEQSGHAVRHPSEEVVIG